MPIEELQIPEEVRDEFGRNLTLTHVFHGIHIEPNEVSAYSVRGVVVDGRFVAVESTRKQEFIKGEDLERLLSSNPTGNDFRVSDARAVRKEIEDRKAQEDEESRATRAELRGRQKRHEGPTL